MLFLKKEKGATQKTKKTEDRRDGNLLFYMFMVDIVFCTFYAFIFCNVAFIGDTCKPL